MIFENFNVNIERHGRSKIRDGSNTDSINSEHSEVPRKEYNYKFNSDDLRSIEFSEKPNVIVMGCSITFGLGLPVEDIWWSLLEKKLNLIGEYKIGNLSYNGSSPVRNVSNFFAFINQYNYLPEYVICNFSDFTRGWFYYENQGKSNFFYQQERLFKDQYPYKWDKIIPLQEIHYENLDAIRALEVFCKNTGIKLIWSTWSNSIIDKNEEFLKQNFKFYCPDTTRKQFPTFFEYGEEFPDKSIENLRKKYRMKNWNPHECHGEIYNKNPEIFDFAYDYHQFEKDYTNGIPVWHPHQGAHRHAHWAEFYLDKIVNYEHTRI